MRLVKFLIMENLPSNGSYCDVKDLKNNVMSDFLSIKKDADSNIFELALEKLNEEQFIFVNKGEKVAATQYGIIKSNQP